MVVSLKKRPIPQNRLEFLRKERKLSMQDLGEMIGKDASYINKLEKRAMAITVDTLQNLARALGVNMADIVPVDQSNPPLLMENYIPVGLGWPAAAERVMIPVYGTAAGSLLEGAEQQLEGPIDQVEAPRALHNAKGLYGLYVVGTSMEPMYRHGDFIVVSPYRPPRKGDPVVIQEKSGENASVKASIGIFDGIREGKPQLRKLNPASVVEIKSRVFEVHKVLTHGELLGVS